MAARQLSDGASAGNTFGQSASDPISFHGVTPVILRSGSAGAAVAHTVGSAVAATSATNSSPYGYAQAQADAIVTNINTLRADVLAIETLVNELRACIVAKGLHTGAA